MASLEILLHSLKFIFNVLLCEFHLEELLFSSLVAQKKICCQKKVSKAAEFLDTSFLRRNILCGLINIRTGVCAICVHKYVTEITDYI